MAGGLERATPTPCGQADERFYGREGLRRARGARGTANAGEARHAMAGRRQDAHATQWPRDPAHAGSAGFGGLADDEWWECSGAAENGLFWAGYHDDGYHYHECAVVWLSVLE